MVDNIPLAGANITNATDLKVTAVAGKHGTVVTPAGGKFYFQDGNPLNKFEY
jgi:hypothetical protein